VTSSGVDARTGIDDAAEDEDEDEVCRRGSAAGRKREQAYSFAFLAATAPLEQGAP
jgi:hypothetical protein